MAHRSYTTGTMGTGSKVGRSFLGVPPAIAAVTADTMPAGMFDAMKTDPFFWTPPCGSLLRAARMVWQHAEAEYSTPGRGRYGVTDQALMLVAMACEAALKGLAIARDPSVAGKEPGVLAKALTKHDLWALAQLAKYEAVNEDQRVALRVGRHFIELRGRYMMGTTAGRTPKNSARSKGLFAVYDAIVLSCVEATSLARFNNSADASKAHIEAFKRCLPF